VRNESAGDLQAALGDFQEALRLEPGSTEAQAGRQRVASRLAEDEFRKRMAAGLLALNAGNFEAARESLLKAKALRPASREVAEALSQTEAGERAERIESVRRKALEAEERESWPEALAAYEAALAIDPRLQFALQGRERSSLRAALSTGIGRFTGQPDLLGTDAHLETAARLLDEARSVQPRGPRLEEQIRKLDELVVIARTPIPVIIESDNLTDVAVYRVGKLGRFTVRELRLRPGTYTVVGARDGYRDERRELVVAPGPEPIRITIACSAKV
jgi:tetratricopeptide (TPR) repeat protein